MCRLQTLPWPLERHRLDLLLPSMVVNGKTIGFESPSSSEDQDAFRSQSVRMHGINNPRLTHRCRHLADRLEQKRAPITLASSKFMRDLRIRLVGALMAFAEAWPDDQLRLMAAIPASQEIRARDLSKFKPNRATAAFRQQLIRAGASGSSGFLISFLESEFEPESEIHRFHHHGLVGGGMIEVVSGLYGLTEYERRPEVRHPLELHQLRPDDTRAEAFSYQLKNHWKQRRIGPVGTDGEVKRERSGRRLSEPFHAESLLFLDRYSLCDMSLLMGCKVGKSGFELTGSMPPICT